jgi:hypothetical protein
MAAADKTLQKMRQNPRGWRIGDLTAVADANGVSWRRPGRGGSHVIFSATGVLEVVSVPDKRPIKPFYVMKFVDLIDAFREQALSAEKTTNKANDNEPKDRRK